MISLRAMRPEDIPALDPILMAAYGNPRSFAPRLVRLLSLGAAGRWLVAELDGRPAGTGGLTFLGRACYIGLVAVEPSLQRRGIASLVMERLIGLAREAGCASILLDASAKGRPLYERLGFVAEDGVSVMERPSGSSGEPPAAFAVPGVEVSTLDSAPAFEELAALDEELWGADRRVVLASYCADDPGRVALARRSGRLAGYAIAQREQPILGPWLARDGEAASALLGWALGEAAPAIAYLPGANEEDARLLARAGFSASRSLTHMRLGEALPPSRRRFIYSQANFAVG